MSNEKLEPKQIVYIHLIALIVNVVWLFTFAFLTEYLQSIICFVIGVLFTIWPCYLIPNLLIKYKTKQEFQIKDISNKISNINNLLTEKNYSPKEYFENNKIEVYERQDEQIIRMKHIKVTKRVIIYKPNTSSKEEIYSTINSIKELFDKELSHKKTYRRFENILLVVFDEQKDMTDIATILSKNVFIDISRYKLLLRNFFIPIAIVLKDDNVIFGKIASNFLLSSKTIAYEAKKDYIINDNSKLYYF